MSGYGLLIAQLGVAVLTGILANYLQKIADDHPRFGPLPTKRKALYILGFVLALEIIVFTFTFSPSFYIPSISTLFGKEYDIGELDPQQYCVNNFGASGQSVDVGYSPNMAPPSFTGVYCSVKEVDGTGKVLGRKDHLLDIVTLSNICKAVYDTSDAYAKYTGNFPQWDCYIRR